MARHMTMHEAAQFLGSRVSIGTLTMSLKRTPAGFLRQLENRWQFVAAAANVPNPAILEDVIQKQYLAIAPMLCKLGYIKPFDYSFEERFEKLTKSCFKILSQSTKSESLWYEMLQRNPSFLDAYVMVAFWTLNVDDAREHRAGISAKEKQTRAYERERLQLESSLARINEEIELNRTRIRQLEIVIGKLTQEAFDTQEELTQLIAGADSSPSPISRADSGHDQGRPPALAGESIAFLDRFDG